MVSTIPVLGKPAGTKDLVVQILCQYWPLSVKELSNRVKRLSLHPVSYQAVHKALGELLESRILEKSENGHSLSLNWIDSNQKFFSGLHASYSNDFIKSIEGKTLEFDTLYAADKFFIQSLQKFLLFLPKRPVLCLHWNHMWLPLFLSKEDYKGIKDLSKVTTSYSLIKGCDPIDKWCESVWFEQGMKVKLGASIASTFDLIILDDFVFEVFYSPPIKQKLDEIYNKTRSIKELDVDGFFHSVFEKKTRILIKVFKDPLLAEELRKQTLGYFK